MFDWQEIERQLAEKREVCRRYRSRRRSAGAARRARPLYAVYDPVSRTVYADGDLANAGALLDAVLRLDRLKGGGVRAKGSSKEASSDSGEE